MASFHDPTFSAKCSGDLASTFLCFTTRQQKYLANNLSSTRYDAFVGGAFSHLDSHNLSLDALLDILITSHLIPEDIKTSSPKTSRPHPRRHQDLIPEDIKTSSLRPWRAMLIELTNADLANTSNSVYYRIQAMLDLLCYSTVQISDDRGLFGPDLVLLSALTDEPDAQEGFTQDHFRRYMHIKGTHFQTPTSVDEIVVAARLKAVGKPERSREGGLLAYYTLMQANLESAKDMFEATKVCPSGCEGARCGCGHQ
jgi:hypothetical protein